MATEVVSECLPEGNTQVGSLRAASFSVAWRGEAQEVMTR
jgi:hypothetical protein